MRRPRSSEIVEGKRHEVFKPRLQSRHWSRRLSGRAKPSGKTLRGRQSSLVTEAGLIQSIRLYHRPLPIVLQFSKELAKRLKDKVDPSLLNMSD